MLPASRERSLNVVDLGIPVAVAVLWVLPLLVRLVQNKAAGYEVCRLLHFECFLVHLMDRLLTDDKQQYQSHEVPLVIRWAVHVTYRRAIGISQATEIDLFF